MTETLSYPPHIGEILTLGGAFLIGGLLAGAFGGHLFAWIIGLGTDEEGKAKGEKLAVGAALLLMTLSFGSYACWRYADYSHWYSLTVDDQCQTLLARGKGQYEPFKVVKVASASEAVLVRHWGQKQGMKRHDIEQDWGSGQFRVYFEDPEYDAWEAKMLGAEPANE